MLRVAVKSITGTLAWSRFTEVILHSLKNYHQERAIEPRRLSRKVEAARGPEILSLSEISNQYE